MILKICGTKLNASSLVARRQPRHPPSGQRKITSVATLKITSVAKTRRRARPWPVHGTGTRAMASRSRA
jgi:hypothetical protein